MCSPCGTVKNVNIYRFGTIFYRFGKKPHLMLRKSSETHRFGTKKPLKVISKEILYFFNYVLPYLDNFIDNIRMVSVNCVLFHFFYILITKKTNGRGRG